jgi:hypothetical protein
MKTRTPLQKFYDKLNAMDLSHEQNIEISLIAHDLNIECWEEGFNDAKNLYKKSL